MHMYIYIYTYIYIYIYISNQDGTAVTPMLVAARMGHHMAALGNLTSQDFEYMY